MTFRSGFKRGNMANDKKIEENKDMGWRERILMEMRKMCVTMQEPRLTASAVICISPRLYPWSVAQYWKCGKYFNSSSSQIHWFNSVFSTNEKNLHDGLWWFHYSRWKRYWLLFSYHILYSTECTFCYRYFHFTFNNFHSFVRELHLNQMRFGEVYRMHVHWGLNDG